MLNLSPEPSLSIKTYIQFLQVEGTVKQRIENIVADGVFTKIKKYKWDFPSFIIPKKDG